MESPNTTTTLTGRSIQDLPNPGGDLTYPAQFAPGALINTAGSSNDFVGGQNGYGNVQFNGLPALSNAYIVDGLETNDPLTNLNSGLNDYDFSTYDTPLVTYSTLAQFTYGVASTATKAFPVAASQPFNYLNLDLFAQDAVKLSSKLTWTLGVRTATNSNPLSPHSLIASLPGSFATSSHNPDQPLNQAIVTGRDKLFASTPLLLMQPRSAIAWQFAPKTVLRTGFGVFSDLLPGSIVDSIAANPPYINTFQGGLLGQAGGTAIAPGVPNSAVDATVAANQAFLSGFQQGALSCAAASAAPKTCLPPVALTAIPDGQLRAPYFLQWSFGIERQLGNTGTLRAQYVGTRAVNQPYSTQVNGYQTVCAGCLSPFPYGAPTDPRFASVTQFTN